MTIKIEATVELSSEDINRAAAYFGKSLEDAVANIALATQKAEKLTNFKVSTELQYNGKDTISNS